MIDVKLSSAMRGQTGAVVSPSVRFTGTKAEGQTVLLAAPFVDENVFCDLRPRACG